MTTTTSKNRPRVTLAIPLYHSARFLDVIIANIEAVLMENVEILISDRHCSDDTIDILCKHYKGDARVKCIKANDKLSWVENINCLLKLAKGQYWRYTPHDDIFPAGSLEKLVKELDTNPDAVLAYGMTEFKDSKSEDVDSVCVSHPHPEEAESGWRLGLVLEMYWNRYFKQSFKGVIRTDAIHNNHLWIRKTLDNIMADRCWMFALCLLGRFLHIPEARYIKVKHESSISAGWMKQGKHILNHAWVMSSYLHDLVDRQSVYTYATRDLWLNAGRRARWHDKKVGVIPKYQPAPGYGHKVFRNLTLPLKRLAV